MGASPHPSNQPITPSPNPCPARPNLLDSPQQIPEPILHRSARKNDNSQPRPETRGGGGGGGRNPAIRALAALTLIAAIAALILHAVAIPAGAQATTDYDTDDNGLIEISNLDQLNAIRWDLDGNGIPAPANTTTYAAAFPNHDTSTSTPMGCPSACEGYELTANLNFDADGNGMVTSTDPYPNWTPIGPSYAAVFDGKGHTISNLTISSSGYAGLFNTLVDGGVVRDVGIIATSVNGTVAVGALVAVNNSGAEITASYVQGGSVAVSASHRGGGLVGYNLGTIRASYSTASVSGGDFSRVGGLVGQNSGVIIASYAAGAVSGVSNSEAGGLVGRASGSNNVITDSYCDATVHGTSTCIGNHTGGSTAAAAGYTTAELQTPTATPAFSPTGMSTSPATPFPTTPGISAQLPPTPR